MKKAQIGLLTLLLSLGNSFTIEEGPFTLEESLELSFVLEFSRHGHRQSFRSSDKAGDPSLTRQG